MAGFNRVMIQGNVGRDPEIRSFPNGGKVANFSIGVSESWKDKSTGERKEKTEWVNISVVNEGLIGAVVERFVKKGSSVLVEGKLRTRKYTAQDGSDRYSTEVVVGAYDGQLVLTGAAGGGGKPSSGGGSTRGETKQHDKGFDLEDDGIPF